MAVAAPQKDPTTPRRDYLDPQGKDGTLCPEPLVPLKLLRGSSRPSPFAGKALFNRGFNH